MQRISVGIDIAKEIHWVTAIDADGVIQIDRKLLNTPTDIATLADQLDALGGPGDRNSRAIRLNTDLAKKPRECLEYILVHELVHLLEPTHNSRFVALMDQFLPGWEHRRDQLNRLPLRHTDWVY